jgi:transposase
MRSSTAAQPATTPLPVQLSTTECTPFLFPPLSRPKRGPKCTRGYHRVFNLILWRLYTGMQWTCMPVPQDAQGQPAIPYTPVYQVFATWTDDGSLWQAVVARGRHLAVEQHLATSVRHGDGTHTVAKTGAMGAGTQGTNPSRARTSAPARTTMALSERRAPWRPSMRRIWCCGRRA